MTSEKIIARTVRRLRVLFYGALVGFALMTVLAWRVTVSDGITTRLLLPKVKQLDRYCALMHTATEDVIQDIVNPIPEIVNDPKDRRTLAINAIARWNALAEMDHRALEPCLRSPFVAGTAYIAPEIRWCSHEDAACAAHYASIALANFQDNYDR